jgi:O-antigen/teichoic acid export membrane protein
MTQGVNATSLLADADADSPLDTQVEEFAGSSPRTSHGAASSDNSSAMPFGRLRSWAVRGSSSVLQQGLFAGAHFVTNILLARWLAPASYGAFALAYSVFLLLLLLYSALFFEPMIVFGAGRYSATFPAYIRVLLRAHFVLLLPATVLSVLIAPLLGRFYTHDFQVAFLWLAVTSSFLLLIWLCRGSFYAQLNTHAGTLAGASYFALLVFPVWILRSLSALSPATAFISMGCGSLLVSAVCLYRFRKRNADVARSIELKSTQVLSDHWAYGRWAALTAIGIWIPANIYYALLPARFGLESAAMLRALMNLIYPLLHTMSALMLLLIPLLVRQRERGGLHRMKRTVVQLVAILVPSAILYLLLIAAFHAQILRVLYAGRYSNASVWAIIAIGILPITNGVGGLIGAALRALERPRLIFFGYIAQTIVALFCGIPICLRYGVSGAAFSLVLGDVATIIVLATYLARSKDSAQLSIQRRWEHVA